MCASVHLCTPVDIHAQIPSPSDFSLKEKKKSFINAVLFFSRFIVKLFVVFYVPRLFSAVKSTSSCGWGTVLVCGRILPLQPGAPEACSSHTLGSSAMWLPRPRPHHIPMCSERVPECRLGCVSACCVCGRDGRVVLRITAVSVRNTGSLTQEPHSLLGDCCGVCVRVCVCVTSSTSPGHRFLIKVETLEHSVFSLI